MEEQIQLSQPQDSSLALEQLEWLHQNITTALGGLVHQTIPLHEIHTVLDVGSGEGGWAIDMVKRYSHLSVTGIDSRADSARNALMRARWQQATRLCFHHMSTDEPLALTSGSFDLVHMQNLGFLTPRKWNTLIAEVLRITRQGGWFNVVSLTGGQTSSPAFNRLVELIWQANPGIPGEAVQTYGRFLAAGLEHVTYSIRALDLGFCHRSPLLADMAIKLLAQGRPLVGSFFSLERYDALVEEARREIQQPYACGYGYLISVAGQKAQHSR